MKQSRMTYEQADVLLYYLESMEEVVRAQVYSQTAYAVICYGKGTDRASVLHALQKFAYQNVEVPVLDATAISVSMLRGDIGTAGSVMFLLNIGEILEE